MKILKLITRTLTVAVFLILATYAVVGIETFLSDILRQPVELSFFLVIAYISIIVLAVQFYSGNPQYIFEKEPDDLF